MTRQIIVLPGDGIGVEVTRAAVKVLEMVCGRMGIALQMQEFLIGGASLDAFGVPIQEKVLATCRQADAVFLGAVGGPEWDSLPKENRPEVALLSLRRELELFTNLRPVRVFQPLLDASTLKPDVIENTDILIVRELTGGIYFGKPRFTKKSGDGERAVDTMEYRTWEIERIAKVAFEAAQRRKKKVTSVDKANVLATSVLWRKTVDRLSAKYSDVTLEHMLVDNCAMQLLRNPRQFDVILTTNLFGDILSDEASMLTGSLGMLPSASLGERGGLYEPVHGSAPDIAGKNVANPLAAIASVALMFRYTFGLARAASAIEQAIDTTLTRGYCCADLYSGTGTLLGTTEMTDAILDAIELNSVLS
ncbi:MAG: 3-isopropylmalate dehydrogenase [bacterium]